MALQDVKLPDIGEGITEGELVKWLVKEGDTVQVDQGLAEILTDKASVEIPSIFIGKVQSLKAKEGDVLQVGQVMLTIKESPAVDSSKAKTPEKKPPPSQPSAQEQPSLKAETHLHKQKAEAKEVVIEKPSLDIDPPVIQGSVLATPATRRLARQLGVDINQVKGTGNLGRVTQEDVKNVSVSSPIKSSIPQSSARQLLEDQMIPLRGIRRKIAEKMRVAKQTIPHFSIMDQADVTELVKLKNKCREDFKDMKITYLPFVMKALISACRRFPMLNAVIDEEAGQIIYKKDFHIGFAADTPDGLLVPVIQHADQKDILEISQEIMALAQKAKAGQLSLKDMTGSTITITNIGSLGGTYATPIINAPEVAIIGMYRVQKTPVFDEQGQLKSADLMNLSCTADHRLVDGAIATRFLRALIQKLESPSLLFMVD